MTYVFSRNLKYVLPMMQGNDVRSLQESLMQHGFLPATSVDGLFGPGTKQAVIAFQSKKGLRADGIAGQNTFGKLWNPGFVPKSDQLATQTGPAASASNQLLIPLSWMPKAKMRRVILHWTAGSHAPSKVDLKHYHIVIDGNGKPHRGNHPISANVPPLRSKKYAAHTKSKNSHSIGVSACSMLNARETPFDPGPFPLTKAQWEALAQVSAELCLRYGIPITRETVLGHGEVQDILGVEQNGKWDPMVLPWEPGRSFRDIGDRLRSRAAQILDDLNNSDGSFDSDPLESDEVPPSEPVILDGSELRGASFDGRTWVDLKDLTDANAWSAPLVDETTMSASFADPPLRFGVVRTLDEEGFSRTWVEVAEVSEKLALAMNADESGIFHLHSVLENESARHVVVQRGQTLSQIARQWLGEASRWTELRDGQGQAFSEETARLIDVGQVVLLPEFSDKKPPRDETVEPVLKINEISAIAQKISNLEGGGTSVRETRKKAVRAILKSCVARSVNDFSHQAYVLATAYHETNLGQFMSELWGPTAIQKTYSNRLGNRSDEDGFKYRGRGFVQITGRDHYKNFGKIFGKDFLNKPELVAEMDTAADILVRGMSEIGFTGKGLLSDMGFDGDFDWFRARSLINGDKNLTGDSRYPGLKKGEGIARKARKYREIIAVI